MSLVTTQSYLVFVESVVAARTHDKRNYRTTYDLWHFVVAGHTVNHLVPATLLVEFLKEMNEVFVIARTLSGSSVGSKLTWAIDWHFSRRTFSVPVGCVPGKVPGQLGIEIRWYPVTKGRP